MDAGELIADGTEKKRRADGRIDAAGQGEEDFSVADLLLEEIDLGFDELVSKFFVLDTGHEIGTQITRKYPFYRKALQRRHGFDKRTVRNIIFRDGNRLSRDPACIGFPDARDRLQGGFDRAVRNGFSRYLDCGKRGTL